MTKLTFRLGSKKVPVTTDRFLQRGRPQTVTDSGGSMGSYTWQGQELDRTELRKVKDMREKGGLVSWLFESKALMKFGTGAELQSENDDLQEWLNENFERLDLLTLDLGSDGIWYPYGLGEVVETRGGEFSHIECIEPWTMLPLTNEYGEIVVWEQETQDRTTDTFQPEEIGSIVLNKSSGRDKIGVSEALRSEEEITQYKENQRAVNKAIEIAGFPHHVWTVGAEGRSPVDDNDLRRVRNLIDNMDGDTQFVVGPDVNHDKITAADFDFGGVTKRDLRILTTTVGLPMEMAGYGREGMGSGSETDLIGDLLALQNEVSRRRFETQFVEEFVRPVVEQYSPFSADEDINMVIDPFLDERDNVADLINKIGEYMTTAEVRDKLDLPPLEDEEIAQSYRSPESVEEAEEEDQGGDMGGLFGSAPSDTDFRSLETRGHPISDPDECNGQVIEGPQGGLRCIPEGGGSSDESVSDAQSQVQEVAESDMSGEELKDELSGVVSETTGAENVDLSGFEDEQAVQVSAAFASLGAAGETDGLQEITTDVSDDMADRRAMANYDPFSQSIQIDPESFTDEKAQEWGDNGWLAGDSVEHLVAHEVGHHQHFQKDVDGQSAGMQAQVQEIPEDAKPEFAEQVSVYATENANEMVAELYAMQIRGEELTTGMENAYEAFNGPEVNL